MELEKTGAGTPSSSGKVTAFGSSQSRKRHVKGNMIEIYKIIQGNLERYSFPSHTISEPADIH